MFDRRTLLCLLIAASLVQATPARELTLPEQGAVGGDTNPDSPSCRDYRTCKERGQLDWLELVAKVTQAQPVDIPSSQKTFDESYGCEFMSSYHDPIYSVREDLERHEFEYRWTEAFGVFSKDPATGEETETTAYTNMFYTAKGLIVADENFKRYDEQKTLHWSELMYHAWATAKHYADEKHRINVPPGHPPGGPISGLQTVVHHQVISDQALVVIRTIRAAKQGWSPEDENWHRFTVAQETREWFFALLAVVNVQGVVWLLRDHAAEIGKKVVTEIFVKWEPTSKPDIWINVGPLSSIQVASE
ncbi:MAG: hypothetical protein Q9216_003608 [Gyalolechia sp. 2 TL-2023]